MTDLAALRAQYRADKAALLADVLAAGKKLLIVADYDADGATACAVGVRGLRLLGALLLLWIGVALCGEENSEAEVGERDTLLAAIRTILFADLATGLDNVVAVAAVADASASGARSLLVACGLGLSIPIVIFGSGLMVQLVRRLPALVMLGGALLGGVAGELLVHERLLAPLRRRGVQSK